MDNILIVQGQEIPLSNLDKVLWPRDNYTKYDLIKFYLDIGPYILKYLKNRPLVFQRYPGGILEKGFYQKNCPPEAPSWVKTIPVPSPRGKKVTHYILVEDIKTLVWLGNQACIGIHPWLSERDDLKVPDLAVFDLDPMEKVTFSQVVEISLAFGKLLEEEGLKGYPKTSGSRGIQIYVPLQKKYTYQEVRNFTLFFCRQVFNRYPHLTTLERKINKREGKIYLDYLQNARGKTINAPYSLRPLPGGPLSAPLLWEELEEGAVNSSSFFNLKNIWPRLKEKGDIMEPMLEKRQSIDKVLRLLS
ncbi:MAG: DNA polymerase domain-containing protein [Candidatus Syntrophonatronum acetioxidans]|uniref:DNA polymerase domain-containing protein n=1 Tax=Candidatus Syntrophonatronum acetioxidans TaxID=1795816 RepID=A0A424YCM7_9FIRM|nr:MAG: DNA polymerase domain-containing protein [Candidatus Syntrophonatronum acetioxidans]